MALSRVDGRSENHWGQAVIQDLFKEQFLLLAVLAKYRGAAPLPPPVLPALLSSNSGKVGKTPLGDSPSKWDLIRSIHNKTGTLPDKSSEMGSVFFQKKSINNATFVPHKFGLGILLHSF